MLSSAQGSEDMYGLSFNEVMSGSVAGAITLRARIAVDDIDAFLADPNHRGGLTAVIDWLPFGTGMTGAGVFELFKPTEDPKLKLMVYACRFEHKGSAYYFDGAKRVRSHSIFHLWSDTTTLYTKIHAGADASGEIAGSGVLKLGVPQLAKMMLSFKTRPVGLSGFRTLMAFGGFFLAQLWNSYVRGASL
jgi:cholesterol oxidase